jgi:two-component system, OmpR family, sensor kinase
MQSLRARLLVWLLGAVLVATAGFGWILYRNALAQADHFFDQQLEQVALSLRDQAFEFALAPSVSVNTDYDFVIQVWSSTGVRVYLSQPHAVVPSLTSFGFSTVATSGGPWRVYGVGARNYVIQVAQPLNIRSRRAAELAFATLRPFALIVPLLGVVIWLVVGRSLRPLERLAASVRVREPHDLAPLRIDEVPDEARPLVDALNDLLARLGAVLQRERAFIADAAHELRTPLTALKLQLQDLAHQLPHEQTGMPLSELTQGVERATRLAEQLLSLARLDPTSPRARRRVALDELVREVVASLIPLADRQRIDLGIERTVPVTLEADEEALRMLVRNLVENALRYTPEKGRVDVAVRQSSEFVELEVQDTGPGIPHSERTRVFDRFYRMPGTAPLGSGLGLSIVKAVAEAHGAEVLLQDGRAGGLRVLVRFPDHLTGC